jgi:protocatechuate 3,4-dioxygenase beta subunit
MVDEMIGALSGAAGTASERAALETLDARQVDPPYDYPGYRSTGLRSPQHALYRVPRSAADRHGPLFGDHLVRPGDNDLTSQHAGPPIGERITVQGRLTDRAGRPIAHQLIELWQANAAGRYAHVVDDHRAPLDPNFTGYGRCVTDDNGVYRFVTIKPGEYPWGNHPNAWRPAHLHFSIFGRAFVERLVTQMYFPGDPLLVYDPMYNAVNDPRAREQLVGRFELALTEPAWALGYRFDIVVGGPSATPFED